MRASILDFRRRMGDILRALDNNEPVTILYRGKEKGTIHPAAEISESAVPAKQHPAFGMWKDRADFQDVQRGVRDMRKGRNHVI